MTFQYPLLLAAAALVCVGLVAGYVALHRQRARALAATGLAAAGRAGFRRHIPPILFLVALALLFAAVARPQGTVKIPRAAGTVVLAFDVSNSMTATDVEPSRLGAAQAAAIRFVRQQPDSVDIGVVAFDQGALTTHQPTKDHEEAVTAINRLKPAGGTSLGQAILGSMTAIVGRPVSLPDETADAPPNLGYWGTATIVLLSDGEDTGGPDALAAAELASNAGIRIYAVGIGTTEGTTIKVDGFQVATSLNEDLLTEIAQTTAGTYHRAVDAQAIDDVYKSLDLRMTSKPEFVELTGAVVAIAVLLLTIGGFLMIRWFGRIL
jgi:Ca-activated chloride channel family protein